MKVAFDFSKKVVDKSLSLCVFIFLIVFQTPLTAQETVLDEVIVSSPRIELSMGQQSRSVTTITAKELSLIHI